MKRLLTYLLCAIVFIFIGMQLSNTRVGELARSSGRQLSSSVVDLVADTLL